MPTEGGTEQVKMTGASATLVADRAVPAANGWHPACKSNIRNRAATVKIEPVENTEKRWTDMEAETQYQSDWTMEGNELPFQKSLYRMAFGFTGNTHGAEDLVQETYMKAFRYYGQFNKGTNLRAWLFKILKNSFINHYRRRTIESTLTRRQGMDFETVPSEPLLPGASSPVEASIVEIDDEVREAMASLPEKYRSVVVLKDLEQYSYNEIARLMNAPIGTVMSRLYRGRKMLEKALMSFGLRKGYLRNRSVTKQRDRSLRAS